MPITIQSPNFPIGVPGPNEFTDELLNTSAIVFGSWVKIVNNASGNSYISSAATNATGQFTIAAPAGIYTVYTGPTNVGPWTPTGNANYRVSNTVPVFNVMDYGAKGDDSTDDLAAFNTTLSAATNGSTIFIPPVTASYRLSGQWLINKNVQIMGSLTTLKSGSYTAQGSVLKPTNATAQTLMGAMIQVAASGSSIENIATVGLGTGNGSYGIQAGASSHGSVVRNIVATGWDSGFAFGNSADHITLYDCILSGNIYGYRIRAGNLNDPTLIDCLLDGNVTASIYLETDASVTNTLLIRTHLGFSPYGILKDPVNTVNSGFDGLVLINSPIESISVQHMSLPKAHGNIRVIGGYWHWNGTPANSAVSIDSLSYGPIELGCEFVNANANSPSVVHIVTSAPNPIFFNQPTGAFALTKADGNYTTVVDRSGTNGFFADSVSGFSGNLILLRNNGGDRFVVTASDTKVSAGRLILGAAASKIVPGATSLSLRNNADNADNLLIADVGDLTGRTQFSMPGPLVLTATASQLVPGATSFSLRNNANNADNLLITDAGAITTRDGGISSGVSGSQNAFFTNAPSGFSGNHILLRTNNGNRFVVNSSGTTISAGDLVITSGKITMGAATSQLVPGATSFSLRNNANAADNILIADAGGVTFRAGLSGITTISLSSTLTMTAATSQLIPGATSLSFRNNANSSDNLLITDAGDVTVRARFLLATAVGKIVPGATSLSLRNNADNADNLLITDAGVATFRGGFAIDAAGHLISTSAGTPTTTNLGTNVTSATFTGNDVRGTIAVVMSGALAANTRAFTATFATSYGATSPKVTLVDQTSAVGLTIVNSYVSAQSTGVSFDVAFDQALAAGTYTLDYIVIG